MDVKQQNNSMYAIGQDGPVPHFWTRDCESVVQLNSVNCLDFSTCVFFPSTLLFRSRCTSCLGCCTTSTKTSTTISRWTKLLRHSTQRRGFSRSSRHSFRSALSLESSVGKYSVALSLAVFSRLVIHILKSYDQFCLQIKIYQYKSTVV